MRFIDGDLQGLELPRDLPILRSEVEGALASGLSITSLYKTLGETHPMALSELVVGPRALRGTLAAEASLVVLEVLETALGPKALYPRLAKLHPDFGPQIAEAALACAPKAVWAKKLGDEFRIVPGLQELNALKGTDQFEEACHIHARLGHWEALNEQAALGSLEPIAALVVAKQHKAAVRAAAALLENHPTADVTAWFAAAAGPACEGLICQVIPHLRSRSAVESLLLRASAYPHAESLLRTLLPAVR